MRNYRDISCRNTEPTAVDASLIIRKHAIPLFKLRHYDVALHIIIKLVGCPDITIDWERGWVARSTALSIFMHQITQIFACGGTRGA
jgi:hypothetical protein